MPDRPDAALDLQFMLEPDFQRFAESLEAQGHDPAELAAALVGLAVARVRMIRENAESTSRIAAEIKRRAH